MPPIVLLLGSFMFVILAGAMAWSVFKALRGGVAVWGGKAATQHTVRAQNPTGYWFVVSAQGLLVGFLLFACWGCALGFLHGAS